MRGKPDVWSSAVSWSAGDSPVITDVEAAVYVIPTDAPEADGTLAWDKTTMVVATARGGGQQGTGWTYAAGAARAVISDVLGPVVVGRPAFDIPARRATWPRPCATLAVPASAPPRCRPWTWRCGT